PSSDNNDKKTVELEVVQDKSKSNSDNKTNDINNLTNNNDNNQNNSNHSISQDPKVTTEIEENTDIDFIPNDQYLWQNILKMFNSIDVNNNGYVNDNALLMSLVLMNVSLNETQQELFVSTLLNYDINKKYKEYHLITPKMVMQFLETIHTNSELEEIK